MTRLPIFRSAVAALSLAVALAGCSNEADVDPGVRLVQSAVQAAKAAVGGAAPGDEAALTDLELRSALQQAGQPILQLQIEGWGGRTLLAPVAVNRGVTTWISNDRINLSSRDGVLLATRGLASDLMSATVPSAAKISSGAGSHQRLHVVLDGADQVRKVVFDCTLASVGPETVTVLGLGYATRHITETCTSPSGTATNHYWFQGGKIRKSTQFTALGGPALTIEAVID